MKVYKVRDIKTKKFLSKNGRVAVRDGHVYACIGHIKTSFETSKPYSMFKHGEYEIVEFELTETKSIPANDI